MLGLLNRQHKCRAASLRWPQVKLPNNRRRQATASSIGTSNLTLRPVTINLLQLKLGEPEPARPRHHHWRGKYHRSRPWNTRASVRLRKGEERQQHQHGWTGSAVQYLHWRIKVESRASFNQMYGPLKGAHGRGGSSFYSKGTAMVK